MRILISLLVTASIFFVSYFVMVHGWGIPPENMGWILFGYTYTILAGGINGIMAND